MMEQEHESHSRSTYVVDNCYEVLKPKMDEHLMCLSMLPECVYVF